MMGAQQDDLGPLFAWRPPKVIVLPFPASRRVGYVRRNAKNAAAFKRPEAVARYFDERAAEARMRLVRAGVETAVAEADASALHAALWREFHRIIAGRGVGSGQPGGAA